MKIWIFLLNIQLALAALGQTNYTPYTFVTLAGLAGSSGNNDGVGSTARFNTPNGVATDTNGNVYVADTYNHVIRKITTSGVVTTLAGQAGNPGSADGPRTVAQFAYPEGVTVDSTGNIYVADSYFNTIRKVTPAGSVSTLAGLAYPFGGYAEGTGTNALFNLLTGVAVDSSGNVYVADQSNNRIRKVTPGGTVSTLAGAVRGYADGTGSAARFNLPRGIAVDTNGNVYVAEYFGQIIRKITPNGAVSTFAGLGSTDFIPVGGYADGTNETAKFNFPTSIALDRAGNFYVADNNNSLVRKITMVGTNRVVSTLAGLAGNAGSADGTGSAARFHGPFGIAADSAGKIYVADAYNDTVRKGVVYIGVPIITSQPQNQTLQAGSNVTFSVVANSFPSPNYQWQFNSQNIPNATNATLTLNSVTAANSGGYSVVVSNPFGSVTSATASLKLLADPANGKPTAQIVAPFCPVPPVNVDSLVFVTHGVDLFGFDDISWITNMANAIREKVPSNWEVRTLDWTAVSKATEPLAVAVAGKIGGHLYGEQLAHQRAWSHVHLIAHSAGSAVIEAIASELKSQPNPPVVHETFLDPYVGPFGLLASSYGSHSDWSDSYFALNLLSLETGGRLPNCHNVDVTWLDTAHISYVTNYCYASDPFGNSTPPAVFETQVSCSVQAYVSSSHGWPHDFYQASINNGPPGAAGYGFPLSEEVNGWNNLASYTNDNPPVVLNGQLAQPRNVMPIHINPLLQFGNFPNASAGTVNIGNLNLNLSSSYSSPFISPSGIHPLGGGASTNIPAWISVGLTITNPVNFVQFDAAFTSVNAEGLLTTYWDTNQVGMVDERVASTNLQTYQFVMPATVTNGVYVLGFRLDSFNGTSSSITITNVATGFVGVDQPITLSVALFTNNTPILQLTGASNYNYLVQSSTNLIDWTPIALLVNSNGTVFFADPTAKNSSTKFYRAVMP